jgi:ATP-dependent Clp protease ATP-binding subunit ClpC
MFERYTEKARRIIFFARYEASQFGSSYIETEHILLGVLREDKALTHRFLRGRGQVEAIRKQIEEATPVREKVSTSVDMPLSNESRRVLAYAAEEAEKLSHQHVDVEHLLLGLLREENSFAAQLLNERGLRLSAVREQIAEAAQQASAERGAPEGKEYVLLSDFSTYLTRMAREDRLLPLIGREKELEQVMHILGRSSKNNVALVGEPGAGKRTIVEGLAQNAAQSRATAFLEDKLFTAVDLSMVVSAVGAVQNATRSRPFLSAVTRELTSAGAGTIFFFEELHHLLAAGPSGGAHEITMLLKSPLLSGKVRCLASATPEEYREALKNARWLERCFVTVEVKPASEAETVAILQGIKKRFETFHSVHYTDDALMAAVEYSHRYMKNRCLPDKAVDLLDDTGAYVKLQQERQALPQEVIEAKKRLKLIGQRHGNAVENHEFEKARFYADEERKEQEALNDLYRKHNLEQASMAMVMAEHVEEVLARWTGVPVATVRDTGKRRVRKKKFSRR